MKTILNQCVGIIMKKMSTLVLLFSIATCCLIDSVKAMQTRIVGIDGWTELHEAARLGNLDRVKFLVEENNANVNARDNDNRTVIAQAVWNNKQPLVEYLLQCRPESLNEIDRAGNLLYWAFLAGHHGMVTFLKSMGANIDARDTYGRTALHNAAINGWDKETQILLKAGANKTCKTGSGNTAEELARLNSHIKLADLIRDYQG